MLGNKLFFRYIENAMGSSEAATRRALLKKLLLQISQNSQENTCAGVSFLNNLTENFLKKKL